MPFTFSKGQKVKVFYDDSNPKLNGKEVIVERQVTFTSPYWIEVSFEGEIYPIRGSEVGRVVK